LPAFGGAKAIVWACVPEDVFLVLIVRKLIDLEDWNVRLVERAERPEPRCSVRRPPQEDVRLLSGGEHLLHLLVLLGLIELVLVDLDIIAVLGGGRFDALDELADIGFASWSVKRNDQRLLLFGLRRTR
jgi:hypothetical protein